MPVVRRSSRLQESTNAVDVKPEDAGFEFAPAVTPTTYENPPALVEAGGLEPHMFSFDTDGMATSRAHGKKKSQNHIPRPPNAFILFRSAFIKSQHVSTGVETNHSTLSKIIGMTWQHLPAEERQKWHSRAKLAQEEHKRRFPQYAFKPVHNKAKRLMGKKPREAGPQDQKRCAKIAELLVDGKKGQELEEAIMEYDKHHVPEIVTRFEAPITADNFSCSPTSNSPRSVRARSLTPASKPRPSSSTSQCAVRTSPPFQDLYLSPSLTPTYDNHSFFGKSSPSFEYDTFAFSVENPPEDQLTPVVGPSNDAFDLSTHALDQSRLTQPTPLYATVEDWTRSCSPMSTSTNSMPTTPAHLSIPFPEQTYVEPSYVVNAGGAGGYHEADTVPVQDLQYTVPLETPYNNDYSQYPTYVPHHPISSERDYSSVSKDMVSVSNFQCPNAETCQTPTGREDLEFSMFMASLPSYSL